MFGIRDVWTEQQHTQGKLRIHPVPVRAEQFAVRVTMEKVGARITRILPPMQYGHQRIQNAADRCGVDTGETQRDRKMPQDGLFQRCHTRVEWRMPQRAHFSDTQEIRESVEKVAPITFAVCLYRQIFAPPLTPAFVVIPLSPPENPHSFKDDNS